MKTMALHLTLVTCASTPTTVLPGPSSVATSMAKGGSDNSGWSVSMNSNGDRVAIGAYHDDDGGQDAGHVRVYEYASGSWTQLGADIDGEAGGDESGYSIHEF